MSVELQAHNQISSGGAFSTLKWKACAPTGSTNPCLSTTNAWTLANATGSTAVWTWDAATGVLAMTGTFQTTSFVSSNANGSPVISDKVVDLVINTTTDTTTAATYNCVEGTFLSSVGANGCLNVSLGDDFTNQSSAVYNVGGGANCVQRAVGGDDVSTGNPRGLANATAAPPCDPIDGAFNFWTVETDTTASGGQLIVRTDTAINAPGANFLTFSAVPTAADDAANSFQDTPVTIDVLANDTSFVDPVTVTTTTPANGTAVVNGSPGNQADIDVTYTPNAGFFGTDTFDYTIAGANATDTATVTVTVVAFGANDDTATTRWNTPVTINVLTNDVGFTNPVTVTKTDGTNGTVVVNGSPGSQAAVNVTYTPAADFVGTDTFTYTVSDGIVPDDTATVTVTVNNEVPTAGPGTIIISTAGVDPATVTGTFNAATGNNLGDAPSVVTATGATLGATSVVGTTVTYTPLATFFQGSDTFSYTITDSDDETATNTVTVTIADLGPTISDGIMSTLAGVASAPKVLVITPGNGSLAQHALNVTTAATNGTCSISGTSLIYTPNAGYAGGDSCVVTITDEAGIGDAATGTFIITVTSNVPNTFFFNDQTGVAPSSQVTSNSVAITGISGFVTISVSGDDSSSYSINGAAFTSTPGTVANGSLVRVRHTSSAAPDTAVDTILNVGGVVDTFTSTTLQYAIDDAVTTEQNDPVVIDVLQNDNGLTAIVDVGIWIDPEHGVLSVSGAPGPPSGIRVTYVPDPGFAGADSFEYWVESGLVVDYAVVSVDVINADPDGDGLIGSMDNCTLVANPTQCDSDGDGYGNLCDGDVTNNGFTNAQDSVVLRGQLAKPSVGPTFNKADLNCNGFVNAQDTVLLRRLLGKPPGPSGLVP